MTETENNKNLQIIDYFLNHSNILKKLSTNELVDLVRLSNICFNKSKDKIIRSKCITILYRIAFSDNILLEDCWQIYWIITSALFQDVDLMIYSGSIDELYTYIFKEIRFNIKYTRPYRFLQNRNSNKIIIITSQFLSQAHAPTIRVLDYSYTIQKYLKKKVTIINDSGMNFNKNECFEPSIQYNFMKDYNNISYIEYKDEKFNFLQINSEMPDIPMIIQILDFIYELNPLFVYNIGGSSLVSDLCTDFTTTICLPCSNAIPVSMSKYLLVGHKINQNDNSRLDRLEPYQKIIETEVNYKIRPSNLLYSREQFGISRESFLIVIIGNRLNKEIDNSFINIVKKILELKNIQILFVGYTDKNFKENIEEIIGNSKNIFYTGVQTDASEIIKLANIYINPKRSGGGRSSFEALYYGVPAITLRYGDVFNTCGNVFAVDSYDEMYLTLKKYILEKDYYFEMKKKAIARANELSCIDKTQEKIFEKIIKLETESKVNG